MKKLIICSLFSLALTTSCVDLDIPPKNIVTSDDLLSNDAGMDIYMARLYSYMPIEDFQYMGQRGISFNSWLVSFGIEGTGEAVDRDGICCAFTGEDNPYWGYAFQELREANYLIENLPKFRSSYPEITYNHYLGEAYFLRATVFYAMACRFGGVPLVTKVIQYPADASTLEVPRSTEKQTWDQVLADYDMAASLLMPTSLKTGYANKYVALAYKSEAMLYAGSVAKYNETVPGRLTGLGQKTGVRVMGFGSDEWEAASKKYFTEAYKAAKEVIGSGKYDLYMKKWAANDPEAQYQNMVDMFSDTSSPENIFVKEYSYPTFVHGYDAFNSPFIFHKPLSSGTCPTFDFIELFDGFERNADGEIKLTDGRTNASGNYLLFDSTMDFYKNAEPRLRAYVIFPGDTFKGTEIEIRAGVYTGATPIKPLLSDYSFSGAGTGYDQLDSYKSKNKTLYLGSNNIGTQNEDVDADGYKMKAAGANGPFFGNGESCLTGLHSRKWLNPDPAFEIGEGKSDQPFILMRYAEVLLNGAEAAVEMSLAGVASPDGSDLMQEATDAVNGIRYRAGAQLLTSKLSSTNESRNIVRKERRKELAIEQKTKWDLRRWRVNHYDGRDGFWGETRDKNVYSNNSRYCFRGLYPFFSTKAGKYFFDAHFQWVSQKIFEYNVVDYYFAIPSGEVAKSAYIDQQPNR